MSKTILVTVGIVPVSERDTSGGTVRVRIPLIDPDNGEPRDQREIETAAIRRACEKLYGRGTFWWPDSGLPGYGQVMRPCKLGGSDAVTYRASLDVEIPELPESHLAALAQRAAEWEAMLEQERRDREAGYAAYKPGDREPRGESYEFLDGWRTARENARTDARYEK